MSDQYSIVEAHFTIVPGTVHTLFALIDTTTDPTTGQPSVTVLGELDGLATSSSGAIVPLALTPFGNTGDSLTAYFFTGQYLYQQSETQKPIVSSSDLQSLLPAWNAGIATAAQINSLDLSYPPLLSNATSNAPNSNSVASALFAAMFPGQTQPNLGGNAPGINVPINGLGNTNGAAPFSFVNGSWQYTAGNTSISYDPGTYIRFTGYANGGSVSIATFNTGTSVWTSINPDGSGVYYTATTNNAAPFSVFPSTMTSFPTGTTVNISSGTIAPPSGQSLQIFSEGTVLPTPAGVPVRLTSDGNFSWGSGATAVSGHIANDGSGSITAGGVITAFPAGTQFIPQDSGGYTLMSPQGAPPITQTDLSGNPLPVDPTQPIHVSSDDTSSIIPASYAPGDNLSANSPFFQTLSGITVTVHLINPDDGMAP